ncbi:MAG: LON peptidase substrate-binding domain-containing protein, partial [bacterium]
MSDFLNLTDIMDAETEFFPLLSSEDEEMMLTEEVPDELPILPLRNTVLFPGVVIPITVGRDKSISLIKEAYKGKRTIGVVAQKDPEIEDPKPDDLHFIGTVARIIKILQMPDGNTTAIIQGKKRFSIIGITQEDPYFMARVAGVEGTVEIPKGKSFDALISSVKDLNLQIIEKSPAVPSEAAFAINNIESPIFLVNFISSNLNVGNDVKQQLLEMTDLEAKAKRLLELLIKDLQMLDLKQDIQKKVKVDMDKQQRDFMLHQQLKTIQEELGGGPHEEELKELSEKAAKKKWPEEIGKTFDAELSKLQRMNPSAA